VPILIVRKKRDNKHPNINVLTPKLIEQPSFSRMFSCAFT